jgi:hypothetical protein
MYGSKASVVGSVVSTCTGKQRMHAHDQVVSTRTCLLKVCNIKHANCTCSSVDTNRTSLPALSRPDGIAIAVDVHAGCSSPWQFNVTDHFYMNIVEDHIDIVLIRLSVMAAAAVPAASVCHTSAS